MSVVTHALLLHIMLGCGPSATSRPTATAPSPGTVKEPDIRIVRVAPADRFAHDFAGCGTHVAFLAPAREDEARRTPTVLSGPGPFSTGGPATVVLASFLSENRCGGGKAELPEATERLAWGHGAMRAYPEATTPDVYVGRLYGGAPVPEHDHPVSWEVLCAIKAKGTYTLAGVAHRLNDGECAKIPPGAKHSWTPDPGTTLEAIQMYAPPGPEDRFRKLAAAERGN